MKKIKPTIHLSGINILLKLLMYEEFSQFRFKYYIIKNKYEERNNKNKYLKKLDYQKKAISALKKKFNINICVLEDLIETNIFLDNQKKKINYSTNSNIFGNNNDFVTNNLFNYLLKFMKGKKISFITEGFGIFPIGIKKNLFNMIKSKFILTTKFLLSKISLSYYPYKIIIFSDPNKWFEKFFDTFFLPYEKTGLMASEPNENYIKKYFEVFSNLSDEFPVYLKKDYDIFHPILKRLSLEESAKLLIDILSVTKGNILVKQHPSDYRDFSKLKNISNRIILLSDELRLFPGEMFIKKNTMYYGEYSSLILIIDKNQINHFAPKSLEYRKWVKNTFYNFKTLINKG